LAETRDSAIPAPQKHFLVIEDDDDSREAFCALIQITGNDAVGVENGARALDYLRSHSAPSAILLDMRMPVMDGWEFRQIQCSDPELRGIPVLVISAEDRFRAQTLASGVAGFISKPIDPEELIGALEVLA